MANEVFANGREISCKSGDGKVVAAFPDVCFTPPENPATPPGVPVPYPISSFSSDDTEGTKNVLINGKEIMLRNISYFKKCTGDEAGAAAKKGVVTSSNVSKTYFKSWSMDVKFEGQNVVRHLDMTTSNHRSEIGNASIPWAELEDLAQPKFDKCDDYVQDEAEKCASTPPHPEGGVDCSQSPGCKCAKACILVKKRNDKKFCCNPGTTGHHLIEDHWVAGVPAFSMAQNVTDATGHNGYQDAPTVCAEGGRTEKEHGILHAIQGIHEDSFLPGRPNAGKRFTYAQGKKAALRAHVVAFNACGCNPRCISQQLDAFYGQDTKPSRDLNQPEQKQAVARTPGEDVHLVREQAEVLCETIFAFL